MWGVVFAHILFIIFRLCLTDLAWSEDVTQNIIEVLKIKADAQWGISEQMYKCH